jgi:peptidoglycan L-alanyl-D-glutamate endopeptidase CwlK
MTEPAQQRDIQLLAPAFRVKVLAVIRDLEGHGLHPIVIETLRTQARQNWLYAQGRTRPGNKVTWTRHSKHQDGIAADFMPADGNWNDAHFWKLLKSSALSHGLRDYVGGTRFAKDQGHVQMGEAD